MSSASGEDKESVPTADGNDEISLLDLLIVLAKHKRLILGITFGAAVLSLVVALLIPKTYTGTATIMPPQEDQTAAAAMLGSLIGIGGSPSSGGIASALGLKSPNDLYVGILKSRTIADRLIIRFSLQELYESDTLVDARLALENKTAIAATKDGLIRIEVEDKDPKRAADVANAYVEELDNLTAQLAISGASQRRLYYQKQVDQAKQALAKADLALKLVQEQTGLIRPDEQAGAIFGAMASLRGRIAAKEIELTAISTFATQSNPDIYRAKQELQMMRKQLAGLEQNNKLGGGDILVPTRKIPQAGLEFFEKWRDVKYYETVYQLLAKQLELAKIEEGRNATIIQFVDKAVAPDKKSKPKRALIVVVTTIVSGFVAVLLAFGFEALARANRNPDWAERYSDLKRLLKFSRQT
ncbi:MAG: GumC family protein [Gemmatimonadaceae bacterium]